MLKKLILPLVLLSLGTACQAPSTPATENGEEMVVGGYTAQSPSDPEMQMVMKEAEKLLQAKYPESELKLTELKKIASQVVAGTNFDLEAQYTDKMGSGVVKMIVFRSLEGKYSLTEDDYQAAE